MDAVAFAKAAKQEQRIKKIIANPDSNSGIVTVPKVIAAGETITIPAGRMAVLPNLLVNGELVADGEVFIPSGGTYTANSISIDELEVTGTGAIKAPSGTTSERPALLSNGLIRYNSELFTFEGYSNGNWGPLGGGATGGGTDNMFTLNGQTITADYTIPVGQNAMTAGDITIASGVTVTVPTGSKWVIL